MGHDGLLCDISWIFDTTTRSHGPAIQPLWWFLNNGKLPCDSLPPQKKNPKPKCPQPDLSKKKSNIIQFSWKISCSSPVQLEEKSHGLWLRYSKTHGHPKYNRPLFLQCHICGLQPVLILLRFAFFCHGASHFPSTSTPRTAFTSPKYRTWFVTLQFSEWNVPLRKFEIAFFFFIFQQKFKLEANQVNVSLYYAE